VSSRVPPKPQPGQSGQAQGARPAQPSTRAVRGTTRPIANLEKPKPIKAEATSVEAQMWSGVDTDRSLEMSMKDVEEKLAELTHADAEAAGEAKEHHEEVREGAEHAESLAHAVTKGWQTFKAKFAAGTQQAQQKAAVKDPKTAQAQAGKPQGSTATSAPKLPQVTSGSYAKLSAVGQAQLLQGAMARTERPPDAFSLLKEAKEKGVLFHEDAMADGHSEDHEDPELAEAVEECIRLCFGVRGILRIGAGKNDVGDSIIVVVASHGFTDAALGKVPEKVHRFATLVAIPYDLLPLKRERLP
jgi:hypothetical protein